MKRTIGLSTLCICVLASLLAIGAAGAGQEFSEFPEFRYHSALPGGGWGVTPTGEPGFDGALQINVPVAYTPHQGFIIGYSSASFDSSPRLEFGGPHSNGTATLAVGLGRPGHGIYLCEMGTGKEWEPSSNIQVQLVPEGGGWPAIAIGIQDILSQRNRTCPPVDRGGGSSPYVVSTLQADISGKPAYLTLGMGWGRFHSRPFCGVSCRAAERITLMAEYDGYNVNAGAAYDLSSALLDHVTLFVGLVDLDRTEVGLTYVYPH